LQHSQSACLNLRKEKATRSNNGFTLTKTNDDHARLVNLQCTKDAMMDDSDMVS